MIFLLVSSKLYDTIVIQFLKHCQFYCIGEKSYKLSNAAKFIEK